MLNNCTFQGRFAADPEMRTTQSGLTVASFRMAVDRDNVGQDGRRATDWLNFVAWRKTAEFVCQYSARAARLLWSASARPGPIKTKMARTVPRPSLWSRRFTSVAPRRSSTSMMAAKLPRRATSSRPIRTSSPSRWGLPPRASANSGREPPIIPAMFRSARAFRRAVMMISRFWTMPMICRSKGVR